VLYRHLASTVPSAVSSRINTGTPPDARALRKEIRPVISHRAFLLVHHLQEHDHRKGNPSYVDNDDNLHGKTFED
jgi:hypothetical protein